MSTHPSTPSAGQPVCPRHTDRVAYVRCQRCNRPACAECQRPAAVGVQCVTCVQEAARTAPVRRSPFGGDLSQDRPLVTHTLIGICVAAWVVQMISSRSDNGVTADFRFAPSLGWVEPWRFVTGAFLHSTTSVMHIVFNMLALWSVGSFLERLLGRWRFLALYLISGIGGNIAVAWLAHPPSLNLPVPEDSWFTGVVGASGAVFGLFAALLVFNRRLGGDNSTMYGLLLINVLISLMPGVSWQAHVGGFVVGGAIALAVSALSSGPDLRRLQWPAILAIGAVVLGSGVVRYLLVDPWVRSLGM